MVEITGVTTESIVADIGALTTASYMPDENHPLFSKLETRAREIFSKFSQEGYWMVEGETELIIGQPSKEGDKK